MIPQRWQPRGLFLWASGDISSKPQDGEYGPSQGEDVTTTAACAPAKPAAGVQPKPWGVSGVHFPAWPHVVAEAKAAGFGFRGEMPLMLGNANISSPCQL